MALNHMIRRISTSNVVPLAVRLASASQRQYHRCSTIISAVNRRSTVCENLVRRSMPSAFHRYFRSLPDEDNALVQVIEEQIVDAKELEGADEVLEPIPEEEFPFEIENNATQNYIKLTRYYRNERIEVIVDMPIFTPTEEDTGADDNICSSDLPVIIRIFKKRRCLELICSAYTDFIFIHSVSVRDPSNLEDELSYEGPEISSLDETMCDAFLKYLEIRGIKPSTTNLLLDYMIKKESWEYVLWLSSIKDFVIA